MKDYRNSVLSIGDEVVYIERDYRNFITSKIERIGKAKVTMANGDIRWPEDVIIVESVMDKHFRIADEMYGAVGIKSTEAFAYANAVVEQQLSTALKDQ